MIWYAAYGSNLHYERFLTYLTGGAPPGGTWDHSGARDPNPPKADQPCWLGHRLYFARGSRWGGGVAAVDPSREEPLPTRARRYLLTVEQFEDVLAQESRRPGPIDLDELRRTGRYVHADGRYGLVLHAGDHDGYPVATFTTAGGPGAVEPERPAPEYRRRLVDGLIESHGLSRPEADAYVDAHLHDR